MKHLRGYKAITKDEMKLTGVLERRYINIRTSSKIEAVHPMYLRLKENWNKFHNANQGEPEEKKRKFINHPTN